MNESTSETNQVTQAILDLIHNDSKFNQILQKLDQVVSTQKQDKEENSDIVKHIQEKLEQQKIENEKKSSTLEEVQAKLEDISRKLADVITTQEKDKSDNSAQVLKLEEKMKQFSEATNNELIMIKKQLIDARTIDKMLDKDYASIKAEVQELSEFIKGKQQRTPVSREKFVPKFKTDPHDFIMDLSKDAEEMEAELQRCLQLDEQFWKY